MNHTKGWNVPDHVPQELVVDFDYMNPPGAQDDVHLAWKSLHAGPDIVWSPYYGGHWIATRGEDIEAMQKDHTRFSHQSVNIPPLNESRLVPLELDPPEHTAYRNLITPAFLPQAIASLESDVRSLAIELIEKIAPRGECEFVSEFSKILPIVIFLRLADLPLSDREQLLEWAEWAVRGNLEERIESQHRLGGYIASWVEKRKAEAGGDLVSLIVNAQIDGKPISPERMFGMFIVVLFGGLDTVASMMGFIARFLAENPAHRQQLIENPELMVSSVDELIRRFGVANTARLITQDMEYKGIQFKKGDQIQLPNSLFGLDDRKFGNPLAVDLTRKPVMHAAFGNGPHRCPGSFLARTEIKVFLQEWLKRIPDFRIRENDKPRCGSGSVNGMLYLPLAWDVAP
ncbi:cytochrome P450 [Paraburkholderia sp. CNPSo 3274]|uniref:cytochrome P450 n=1 Tax=Paraburkholderia sp. CNPSo 3274 TaxID=2940932 RepID=UPI0020B7AF74|nr:cytochrome P450 [Paraburkholderia sp. CNPSo 3274]MCP3710494.1 cytochrome P450 [Paraburkholderia sp. CNPSo 3274]